MKRAAIIAVLFGVFTCPAQTLLPAPTVRVIAEPTLPPPTPAVPVPAITAAPTLPLTPGTNAPVLHLSDLLTNLQAAVQQTLPALANFNDSFDFVVLGANGVAQLVPDAGSNLAGNGGANAFSLTPGAAVSGGGVAGTLVTNATPTATLSRGQVAEFLILENDLERLLPMLSTLNGVPITGVTNRPSQ